MNISNTITMEENVQDILYFAFVSEHERITGHNIHHTSTLEYENQIRKNLKECFERKLKQNNLKIIKSI